MRDEIRDLFPEDMRYIDALPIVNYIEDLITKTERLERKIECLENDYYHALAILMNDEKITKRKLSVLKDEYANLCSIREARIKDHISKLSRGDK